MGIRSIVLLSPSAAAAVEWPRRLADRAGAQAALYPMRVVDLARTIAEPTLLGKGLRPWTAGHAALIASRLLDEDGTGFELPADLPRAPIATALARTLMELRRGGVAESALSALLEQDGLAGEDKRRLEAVSRLRQRFEREIEGRFADPTTLLRAASEPRTTWLTGAQLVLLPGLKLEADERGFIEALAERLEVLELPEERPPRLSYRRPLRSVRTETWANTPLAPAAPATAPAALQRLRTSLFEPLRQDTLTDDSVELRTAPGEAAEVRNIARCLIAEAARGVPFEEMAVALARPESYAPLFTDLLTRLGVPHRLHPSLPLRFGRSARSLLLLFRCRGLARSAVMEFLTFAPIPFAEILEREDPAPASRWDEMSRDAGIVSELPRWSAGLESYASAERSTQEKDPERRARREARARDAGDLLRIVKRLSASLERLDGQATFAEWSIRLHDVMDDWLAEESDRAAVAAVIDELPALDAVADSREARASWREVEAVLEARFEWERLPLVPAEGGAVHVGALDAIAGLPFRVMAIPGLVEGGFPGALRPDPFLLDTERERLVEPERKPEPARAARSSPARQLSLFGAPETAAGGPADGAQLGTSQDRLLEARGRFHRAVSQATEKLILTYPRADPRTGRERLPSLFFVAAAAALRGGPIDARVLHGMVVEQDPRELTLEASLDASERDRIRIEAGGEDAAHAVASGSVFFRQSRLASRARLSRELTAYDGWVAPLPAKLKRQLDPVTAARAMSASRLGRYSMCGFWYFLEYVLKLEPALEPEERKRLEPIERGRLFHDVAERFLRERRERGELPVTATPAMRKRAMEMADEALDGLVAGSPPRFLFLWERERRRFKDLVVKWLDREERNGSQATPAHFEVAFGPSVKPTPGERSMEEPLVIELGDGRELRVSGKIDRIDERENGTLVLRDYKTGRAPRDDGGIFRGGRQLQIPFYILAAEGLFPEARVVEAFLDYVDGGRQVALDPSVVKGETFRKLLRGLSEAIAGGVFVQDPSACNICDFNIVCGPKPLIARRLHAKRRDERVQLLRRLREIE